MLVGIDATSWSNKRGYGRFTRSLIEALFKESGDNEYILFVDHGTKIECPLPAGVRIEDVSTSVQQTKSATASGSRSLADMFNMSRAVSKVADLDVFFFPTVYSYFPILTKAKVIVGIHDVIAEDYPDLVFPELRSRIFWNLKSWLARQQAHMVMTVSEHAKAGLKRQFGLRDDKLWVVGEAPDPIFRQLDKGEIDYESVKKYKVDPDSEFLLYMGGINPHKNLVALVEAFDAARSNLGKDHLKLVIVGDTKDGFTPGLAELRKRIDELKLNESVVFTGFVPDADVVHIINLSTALVLPSFAEGFGLPAIEAAACGTPIIATRNSPLPDLLPGAGLFIDPANLAQLTEALKKMLSDRSMRAEMADTALEAARRYTWKKSACQMNELLLAARS